MSLLFTALILKGLGLSGTEGMVATILVAAVICTAAAIAGDTMQDLATGYLVGATPKRQQVFEVMGTFFAALVMAPVLNLLIKAYGIAGTPTAKGENALPAPQAFLMAKVTEGVFTGTLEWTMVFIGAGIAIALIIIDEILARRGSKFRTPVMPVAVGIYLPLSLGVPILLGGIARYLVSRGRKEGESFTDPGVLGAAGLIAGEALTGIVFAALIVGGIAPSVKTTLAGNILGVLFLLALLGWLTKLGRK